MHPASIRIGGERILYFVSRLLYAVRNCLSGLLGFVCRRFGNVLGGIDNLPNAGGNQTSNYRDCEKSLHSIYISILKRSDAVHFFSRLTIN